MPIVDAHHHLWRLARGDYDWLTPTQGVLFADYEPEDLALHMAARGVAATVAVQAAPTAAETDFLLATAERHPWIQGVVGWTDLAAPDAAQQIARLADKSRLVGLRPMLQDLPDRSWILADAALPGLDAMARHGLVFDALVREDQLGVVAELARRQPALAIVLDHAGKPSFSASALRAWDKDVRAIAAAPNTHVKLSGLLTEAPPDADAALLRPLVSVLLDAFGPDRVVWGSDWPVLNLAGNYAGWLEITAELLADLTAAHRTAIMGGNAVRLYGLQGPFDD